MYKFKHSRKLRGKQGVTKSDCYDLQTYLAKVIANGCRILDKTRIGTPGIIYVELGFKGHDCDFTDEETEAASAKWSEILNKIATGFELGLEADDNWEEADSPHFKQFHEAFELFHKYFFNLWY